MSVKALGAALLCSCAVGQVAVPNSPESPINIVPFDLLIQYAVIPSKLH